MMWRRGGDVARGDWLGIPRGSTDVVSPFHVSYSQVDAKWNLYNDIIVIIGNKKPGPQNKLVPSNSALLASGGAKVEDKASNTQKYKLFKEHNIINLWRALEDQRKIDHRVRGKPSDVKIDIEPIPSRRRKRRKTKAKQ
ncbi:hypothetical protein LguiB_012297 [Lonicera macranthoides]